MAISIKWLLNRLDTNLTLKGGDIDIPPGGSAKVLESELVDQTISYAITRDWVDVLDEAPDPSRHVAPVVEIDVTKPFEGLTEEELKEELASKAATTDSATGTALGQGEAALVPAEVTETPEPTPHKTTKKAK